MRFARSSRRRRRATKSERVRTERVSPEGARFLRRMADQRKLTTQARARRSPRWMSRSVNEIVLDVLGVPSIPSYLLAGGQRSTVNKATDRVRRRARAKTQDGHSLPVRRDRPVNPCNRLRDARKNEGKGLPSSGSGQRAAIQAYYVTNRTLCAARRGRL